MIRIILALCFLLPSIAASQAFELGEVSHKEISETVHSNDALASAAILYKSGTTSFDFDDKGNWVVITDVSIRLKIYDKKGLGFATVEIPYNGADEVDLANAVTYNIEGGKIVKSKSEDQGKVIEDSGTGKIKTITLPNVKEGSVIEYRYIITSHNYSRLPDWYFQHSIPVNNVQYGVYIPHYFVYNRLLSPYITVAEKQETKKQTKTHSNPNPRGDLNKSNANIQWDNGSITFYEVRKTYTAHNVPALYDTGFTDNIENYRGFVKHELASAEFPNSLKKDYTSTWDAVAKLIYNEKGFADELNQNSYFEKDIDAILAKTTQRDEVIAAVFDYVKSSMVWDGQYGYNTTKMVTTAHHKKSGNVAEINLMLVAMLRYAGLNANPVVLSTRDHGRVSFVNRDEFNYVIAGVESQNGIKFLDATSKNALPGILPLRAINGTGRIIRDNLTSEEVDLMPVSNSKTNTAITAKINPDGVITGHVKKHYFDYNAYFYRDSKPGVNKEYEEMLKNEYGLSQIKNYTVADTDLTKPVIEDFSFESNNLVESLNGKLYVSPMLFYIMKQSPFVQDKRSYPVDFIFPYQDRYTYSITLPEGYAVESLPESAYYQIKDNVGGFRFNISATRPDQIQVSVVNDINYAMVSADYYLAIKEYFANVVKKQSERIVLKKSL